MNRPDILNFKEFAQRVKKDNVTVCVFHCNYAWYAYAYLQNGHVIFTRSYKDFNYLMSFVQRNFGDNYKI